MIIPNLQTYLRELLDYSVIVRLLIPNFPGTKYPSENLLVYRSQKFSVRYFHSVGLGSLFLFIFLNKHSGDFFLQRNLKNINIVYYYKYNNTIMSSDNVQTLNPFTGFVHKNLEIKLMLYWIFQSGHSNSVGCRSKALEKQKP